MLPIYVFVQPLALDSWQLQTTSSALLLSVSNIDDFTFSYQKRQIFDGCHHRQETTSNLILHDFEKSWNDNQKLFVPFS